MARREVPLFLLLTFGWAWALWGWWVVAMPPGGLVLSPAFLVCAMVGGFAPSLAALIVLGLGRSGAARDLLRRLLDWPGTALSLLSLLLAPAFAVVGWMLQPPFFRSLAWPDLAALLPVLLVWPLLAALGEELGWRGFLYPRLMPRFGAVGAAVAIGLVWGLWHLPADFVGLKASGPWFWLAFLVNGPYVLTGHALVMAWLWRQTGGNLVSMVLYHLGITASAMLAPSPGTDALAQIASAAIGASVVWLGAIVLWLGVGREAAPATGAASGPRPPRGAGLSR